MEISNILSFGSIKSIKAKVNNLGDNEHKFSIKPGTFRINNRVIKVHSYDTLESVARKINSHDSFKVKIKDSGRGYQHLRIYSKYSKIVIQDFDRVLWNLHSKGVIGKEDKNLVQFICTSDINKALIKIDYITRRNSYNNMINLLVGNVLQKMAMVKRQNHVNSDVASLAYAPKESVNPDPITAPSAIDLSPIEPGRGANDESGSDELERTPLVPLRINIPLANLLDDSSDDSIEESSNQPEPPGNQPEPPSNDNYANAYHFVDDVFMQVLNECGYDIDHSHYIQVTRAGITETIKVSSNMDVLEYFPTITSHIENNEVLMNLVNSNDRDFRDQLKTAIKENQSNRFNSHISQVFQLNDYKVNNIKKFLDDMAKFDIMSRKYSR